MSWRDPYLWPDVDTLKNKAGIKNHAELTEYEGNFTQFRIYQLLDKPILGNFDIRHLCKIHYHIFQDVYDFAGQLRMINISKNEMFASAPEIPRLSEYLFTQLQKENFLSNLPPNQFAERAALYFNAINAIHPFREGNGRTQRLFIEQLAKEAGHTLNLEAVSNKITMVDASKQGISTNIDEIVTFRTQRPTLFIDLFQKAINPAYVDIMQQARIALTRDSQMPELVPAIDGAPMLIVQGMVLAKNEIYTAQLHGMKWFAIHQNSNLLKPLEPGNLAIVQYNQQSIGTVKHVGKALEFLPPSCPPLHELKQAKPVVRLDTVYQGEFVHIDDTHVYQKLSHNNIVKHQKIAFVQKQLPEIGKYGSIKYEYGQAQLISQKDIISLR